jgi:hypothetical protein
MDRNERARVIYRAEALERRTKPWGKRNGALGQNGLALLRCLLFRYGANPCPSYADLQRATGICVQTIADCLRRLETAGLLAVERKRTRKTAAGARRIANRYTFPHQASLPLLAGEQGIPSKRNHKKVLWKDWAGPVKDALERLGRVLAPDELHPLVS